jgi:hypothetical protein
MPTAELWSKCRCGQPLTDDELLDLFVDTYEVLESLEKRGNRYSLAIEALRRDYDVLLGFVRARDLQPKYVRTTNERTATT